MKFILIRACALLWCCSADAQTTPRLLPFQGRLTDSKGAAVADGARLVQFKLFAELADGSPVWDGELHRTTVNGGLINVLLGSKIPFPSATVAGNPFFDQPLYLEITVDINGDNAVTAADAVMQPRQMILPAPFASESANSRKMAGHDWSSLFGANDPSGKIDGAKLADRSVTSDKLGNSQVQLSNLAAEVMDRLVPVGTVISWMGAGDAPPPGWEFCRGQTVRRADPNYARLFQVIKTAGGAGDGETTFVVPDLRGMFLRGVNGERNDGFHDPDAAVRPALSGGNQGNQVGSVQPDEFKQHQHQVHRGKPPGTSDGFYQDITLTLPPINSTASSGGSETRPKNVYVHYLIKL